MITSMLSLYLHGPHGPMGTSEFRCKDLAGDWTSGSQWGGLEDGCEPLQMAFLSPVDWLL